MKSKEKTNPLKINEVKGYRIRSGILPGQMAKKLNISRNNYYTRENGAVAFTINDLVAFSKAVNLNIEEVLGLLKNPYLLNLLLAYKEKIVKETQEREREYYKRLLEERDIDRK